jgi:hypothetical protein
MADRSPTDLLQQLLPLRPGRTDPAVADARRAAARALADSTLDVGASGQGGSGSASTAKSVAAAQQLAADLLDI